MCRKYPNAYRFHNICIRIRHINFTHCAYIMKNNFKVVLADDNLQEGCHEIPRKYGTGQICVCDSNLCNSASSLNIGTIPSKFSLSVVVKYASIHSLYFPGFMFVVFMQKKLINITWILCELIFDHNIMIYFYDRLKEKL